VKERTSEVQLILDRAFEIAGILVQGKEWKTYTSKEIVDLAIRIALSEAAAIEVSVMPIATVDVKNVAFSLGNEDVSLVRGDIDFLRDTDKIVWNYGGDDED
jgi:hypothetical protein